MGAVKIAKMLLVQVNLALVGFFNLFTLYKCVLNLFSVSI